MILASRIISYAGLLVALVGTWVSTGAVAALIITSGTLLLGGGSWIAGLRRRRARGNVGSREDAEKSYRNLRVAFIANRWLTPLICLLILFSLDSTLGRALIVGGLLVGVLASVPDERQMLARLREQAGGISDAQQRFRLVEHDPRWDTEGYPNRFIEALDRYPAQATIVTLGVFGVFLGALAAIAHFV